MNPQPCEILVEGSSTISRRAERALLPIRLESTGTSKQQVSEDVTKVANELQGLFNSLNVKDAVTGGPTPEAAVTWFSMKGITTRTWIPSHWDHTVNRNVEGTRTYSASTSFSVKFKDFRALSSIATDLAVKKFINIDSVQWLLTDETKASLASENRKKAYKDALARGNDYASEIGGQGFNLRAIEVTEGTSGSYYGMPQMPQMYQTQTNRAGMMRPGGGGGEGVDLSPEDVDLNATVKVKFVAEFTSVGSAMET